MICGFICHSHTNLGTVHEAGKFGEKNNVGTFERIRKTCETNITRKEFKFVDGTTSTKSDTAENRL